MRGGLEDGIKCSQRESFRTTQAVSRLDQGRGVGQGKGLPISTDIADNWTLVILIQEQITCRWCVQADVFDVGSWRDQLDGAVGVISCLGAFGSNDFMQKVSHEDP